MNGDAVSDLEDTVRRIQAAPPSRLTLRYRRCGAKQAVAAAGGGGVGGGVGGVGGAGGGQQGPDGGSSSGGGGTQGRAVFMDDADGSGGAKGGDEGGAEGMEGAEGAEGGGGRLALGEEGGQHVPRQSLQTLGMDSFTWLNDPGAESRVLGDNLGCITPHGANAGSLVCTVWPPAQSNFWARTLYHPLVVKEDAPALLTPVLPADEELTLHCTVELHAQKPRDQAGGLVLVDSDHWMKAAVSMEREDGGQGGGQGEGAGGGEGGRSVLRLTVVVTNGGYSDWSVSTLPTGVLPVVSGGENGGEGGGGGGASPAAPTAVSLRIHKLSESSAGGGGGQGPCVVVEAGVAGPGGPFSFVRAASLRSGTSRHRGHMRMGVFAASPSSKGSSALGVGEGKEGQCRAVFRDVRVGPSCAAGTMRQRP